MRGKGIKYIHELEEEVRQLKEERDFLKGEFTSSTTDAKNEIDSIKKQLDDAKNEIQELHIIYQ